MRSVITEKHYVLSLLYEAYKRLRENDAPRELLLLLDKVIGEVQTWT